MFPTNTSISNRYSSSSSLQGTTKPNIKLTEQSHIGDVEQNNADISCIVNQARENNVKYASQQPYPHNMNFNGGQFQRAIHMQYEHQRLLMEQYAQMVRSAENMQRNSNMPAQFMHNSIPMYQHNFPPNYYYPSPFMYPQPPPSMMGNPNLYYMQTPPTTPPPYPNPNPNPLNPLLNMNQDNYSPTSYLNPDKNIPKSPRSENGKNPLQYVFEIFSTARDDQFLNLTEKNNKQQKEDVATQQKNNMKQSAKQSISSHNSVKTNIQSLPNPTPNICINLIQNNQLLDTSKRIKNNYHSLHEQHSNDNHHINVNDRRNFKKIQQSNFPNTVRSQQQNIGMHYLQAPVQNSPQKSLKRIKTQSSIESRDQNEIKLSHNKNSMDIGVQTILNTLGNYVENMSSQVKRSQLRSRDYYLNNSIKPLDYIDLPPQFRQQLRDPQIRMVESTMQSIYPNMTRKEEMSKTKKINNSRNNNNYNMLRINEENSSMVSSNVYSQKQGQKPKYSNQQHKKSFANANSISIHSSENKQQSAVDGSEDYMEESVVQTKEVLKYKDKLIQNPILPQNKTYTPLKTEIQNKIELVDQTNNNNNYQDYDAYSETNSIKLQKSPDSSQLHNSQYDKMQQKNSIKYSFKYKSKQQQEKQVKNIQKSKSLQTIISVSKLTNLISGFSQLKQLIQFQFPKFNQYVQQSFQELTLYFNKLLMEKEEKIITLELQKNCLFDRIKFLQENSTVNNKSQQMNNILNSIPSPKSGAGRASPKMQVIIKQPYFKSQGDKNKNFNEVKDEKKQKQQQQYLEDVKTFRQYKLWRQISSVENLLEGQIHKMQQNRQRQFNKVLNKNSLNIKVKQEL